MPAYSEKCSATLASTYSSGDHYEGGIITSDLHNGCTKRHTGTSAAAPIAAGIIALTLEANPNITWRDIQHLIVLTSDTVHLDATDWQINGAGKRFSHNYGFGLINAGLLVERAIEWKSVSEQLTCDIIYLNLNDTLNDNHNRVIKSKESKVFSLNINLFKPKYDDLNLNDSHYCSVDIQSLEHVLAIVTLHATERGQIEFELVSPGRTRSKLLATRIFDRSSKGFRSWPLMSVHFWGEKISGLWELIVFNNSTQYAFLDEFQLTFYGFK
jgi:subtilisin-like proprotein convertase family protein